MTEPTSIRPDQLPATIRDYLTAHQARDTETALGAFAPTAVVVDEDLIDVEPGDTTARCFGLAFDLGTTTVVASLLDVATGTPVAVSSRART